MTEEIKQTALTEFERFKEILAVKSVDPRVKAAQGSEEVTEMRILGAGGCDLQSMLFGMFMASQVVAEVAAASKLPHELVNIARPPAADEALAQVMAAIASLMGLATAALSVEPVEEG